MIFISAPYSHKEKNVENERYKHICHYAAYLFSNNKLVLSPVMIGHPCLDFAKLPGDFAFWKNYSIELLSKCDELHVLQLDEWKESIGVTYEIGYANEKNIPVKYIKVELVDYDVMYEHEEYIPPKYIIV